MTIGVGLALAGGLLGAARTGRWSTWDGPVTPNEVEWRVGLTGATLFLAPLLHLALQFSWTWIRSSAA